MADDYRLNSLTVENKEVEKGYKEEDPIKSIYFEDDTIPVFEKFFVYTQGVLPAGVASLTCTRDSSDIAGASTGTISNGDKVYPGDKLHFSATVSTGYTLSNCSYTEENSYTVSGNVNGVTVTSVAASRISYTISFGTTSGKSLYGSWENATKTAYFDDKIIVSGTTVTCYKWDARTTVRWANTVTATADSAQYSYTTPVITGSDIDYLRNTASFTAENTRAIQKYTVTFSITSGKYGSWSPASIANVPYGTTISRSGNTVTVGSLGSSTFTPPSTTVQYNYASPEYSSTTSVTGNTTYNGGCTRSDRTYTIKWIGSDGTTVLETDNNVAYGAVLTYNGSTPTKTQTDQYTYTFSAWKLGSTSGSTVTSGTTTNPGSTSTTTINIYSTFSSNERSYTVTFTDGEYGSWSSSSITALYSASISRNGDTVTVGSSSSTYQNYSTTGYTTTVSYTGASGTVGTGKTISVTTTRIINQYPLTIDATYCKATYLSTNSSATSGSASGTSYDYETEVYGFATLNDDTDKYSYTPQSEWTQIGTSRSYNVGSKVISTSGNSISVEAIRTVNKYAVVIGATTYCKAAYLSTDSSATSGSVSGTTFDYDSTVYLFVTLNDDTAQYTYTPNAEWTQIGTSRTYRVASLTVETSNTFADVSANRTLNTYTVSFEIASGNYGEWDTETIENVPYGTMVTMLPDPILRTTTIIIVDYGSATFTPPSTTVRYNYSSASISYPAVIEGDTIISGGCTRSNRTYTINWIGADEETVLETDTNVLYNAVLTYNGNTPTKASTAQYNYTFSAWKLGSTSGTTVTSGTTTNPGSTSSTTINIYATFTSTTRSYTVRWYASEVYDEGLKVVLTETYDYGALPSFNLPAKYRILTADNGKECDIYTSWDDLSAVTGDRQIRAQYQYQIYVTISGTRCSADYSTGWVPYNATCTWTASSNCAFNSSGTTTQTASLTTVDGSYSKSANYIYVKLQNGTNCSVNSHSAGWQWLQYNTQVTWKASSNYAYDSSGGSFSYQNVTSAGGTYTGTTPGYGYYALSLTNCSRSSGSTAGWYTAGSTQTTNVTASSNYAYDSSGTTTSSCSATVPGTGSSSPGYGKYTLSLSNCSYYSGTASDTWHTLGTKPSTRVRAKVDYSFGGSSRDYKDIGGSSAVPCTVSASPGYGYYGLSLTNCAYYSGTQAGWYTVGSYKTTKVKASSGYAFDSTGEAYADVAGYVPTTLSASPGYGYMTISATHCSANKTEGWKTLGSYSVQFTSSNGYSFNGNSSGDTYTVTHDVPYTYSASPSYYYLTVSSGSHVGAYTNTNYNVTMSSGWYSGSKTVYFKTTSGWAFDSSGTTTKNVSVSSNTTASSGDANWMYWTVNSTNCTPDHGTGWYQQGATSIITWTSINTEYRFSNGSTTYSQYNIYSPGTYSATASWTCVYCSSNSTCGSSSSCNTCSSNSTCGSSSSCNTCNSNSTCGSSSSCNTCHSNSTCGSSAQCTGCSSVTTCGASSSCNTCNANGKCSNSARLGGNCGIQISVANKSITPEEEIM